MAAAAYDALTKFIATPRSHLAMVLAPLRPGPCPGATVAIVQRRRMLPHWTAMRWGAAARQLPTLAAGAAVSGCWSGRCCSVGH